MLQKKEGQSEMKKDSRISNAQDAALDRGMDYIMGTHPAPDFVEVVGSMGGEN